MKKNYAIHCLNTGKVLYEGQFASFKHCLEQAVTEQTSLQHADLRRKNLSGANLDDAQLQGSDFTGSNLSGTNLSESVLEGANFSNAALVDACLSYSNLGKSLFYGARFGATDIAGCKMPSCTFSGLSTFTLDFMDATDIAGSTYLHLDLHRLPMNTPPRVLRGWLNTPVILLDHHAIIGNKSLCASSLGHLPLLASFFDDRALQKILT